MTNRIINEWLIQRQRNRKLIHFDHGKSENYLNICFSFDFVYVFHVCVWVCVCVFVVKIALPSIKSSSVWARFWIKPRQFFDLDAVAAWVVVVVIVGTVVVRTIFVSISFRSFANDSISARSSSELTVLIRLDFFFFGWF